MAEPLFDNEIEKLRAEIGGLRIVVSVALNLIPDQKAVVERLKLMEETARRQNLASETTAVLREFREAWTS